MRTLAQSLASSLLACGLAVAQNITGAITGAVDDPAGARVAGAKVVAINKATGVRYSTATNEAGLYVIAELPLGDYSVTIEAAGFKTFVHSNLLLGADARLRLDAALELGSASEHVTVTAEAPLVESERATLGGSFRQSFFENLPIGRDPLNTLQLIPGSQPSQGGYATGVFNGAHEETTDYKVDGAAATLATTYRAPQPPILEMVEEVVLQTSTYSAEFGNDSRTEPPLRAPGEFNLQGLLQKEFRFAEKRWLEFRCQASNALNHFNPGMPNSTIGAPGVGTITGGNGDRRLQSALRLHY